MVVIIIVIAIVIRCEICRRLFRGVLWVFYDSASFWRTYDVGSGQSGARERLSCLVLLLRMAVDESITRHACVFMNYAYICFWLIYVFGNLGIGPIDIFCRPCMACSFY